MSTKSLRQTIEVLTRAAADLAARLDQAEMDLDVERGASLRMSRALAEISCAIHGTLNGINPERPWREILPAVQGLISLRDQQIEELRQLQDLCSKQRDEIAELKQAVKDWKAAAESHRETSIELRAESKKAKRIVTKRKAKAKR